MEYQILASTTVFLLVTTFIGDAAFAEPKDHAPAYGYRAKDDHKDKKHKKYKKHEEHSEHYGDRGKDDYDGQRDRDVNQPRPTWGGYDSRYSNRYGADNYGIAQGTCRHAQLGGLPQTNIGGALGNAIGNAMGGNQLLGAIAGAVVNQMLGVQTGQAMDQGDRLCFSQTLEYGYDQRPVEWFNQSSNKQYSIVPLRSFQDRSGNWCREFSYQLSQNRQIIDRGSRTACRLADGAWQ